MGIDVYLNWDQQTKAEKEAQYTGFDITKGNVGYLREAYHGGPYATKVLVPEAWAEGSDGDVTLPTATLKKRLPAVIKTVKERAAAIYKEKLSDDDPIVKSFADFVALHERLELAGLNPRIVVSA